MFTEEFKKYLFIGITIVLIIVIALCANVGNKGPLKDSSFKLSIIISESLDTVNDWIKKQFSFARDIFALKESNEELEKQIEELELQNSMYQKYKNESEELKELLDIKQEEPYETKIAARVVGVDPNSSYKVLIINKGIKDNVKKDMIVLSSKGLAGRVIESGDNYSKVMALTDDRTTIGAVIERTGEKLVLNGNNIEHKNTCRIENIELDSDILVDDEILTSNVSMLYPEGLKIGKVKEIRVANNELTKTAIIETFTNVNALDYVYVIKNKEMLEEEIEEIFNGLDSTTIY